MKVFLILARMIGDSHLPRSLRNRLEDSFIRLNNKLTVKRYGRQDYCTDLLELKQIREKSHQDTVISDHLETIFIETLAAGPSLIVELGVENGSSTFVFERAARLCGAKLVSVDYNDCSKATDWDEWMFIQSDDIAFADRFPEWRKEKGLPASIDLLFIDTDHHYEHTVKEINKWFPLLSPGAVVIFHDSNVRSAYYRKNGTIGRSRDFKRGVIRAIEDYVGFRLDEQTDFTGLFNKWLIRHYANSNGLTIMKHIPELKH